MEWPLVQQFDGERMREMAELGVSDVRRLAEEVYWPTLAPDAPPAPGAPETEVTGAPRPAEELRRPPFCRQGWTLSRQAIWYVP